MISIYNTKHVHIQQPLCCGNDKYEQTNKLGNI